MNRITRHFPATAAHREFSRGALIPVVASGRGPRRSRPHRMSELDFIRWWKPAVVDLLQPSPTHHPE
jgi:hypothetical protein